MFNALNPTHRNAENSSPGTTVFDEDNSAAAVAKHKLEDPASDSSSSTSAAAVSATKTNGVHSHEQVNCLKF